MCYISLERPINQLTGLPDVTKPTMPKLKPLRPLGLKIAKSLVGSIPTRTRAWDTSKMIRQT